MLAFRSSMRLSRTFSRAARVDPDTFMKGVYEDPIENVILLLCWDLLSVYFYVSLPVGQDGKDIFVRQSSRVRTIYLNRPKVDLIDIIHFYFIFIFIFIFIACFF